MDEVIDEYVAKTVASHDCYGRIVPRGLTDLYIQVFDLDTDERLADVSLGEALQASLDEHSTIDGGAVFTAREKAIWLRHAGLFEAYASMIRSVIDNAALKQEKAVT